MLDKLKATLKAFWTKLTTDVGQLWQSDKAFLIAFGAIILAIKFHNILISLVVASARNLFNSTENKTSQIQNQENQANTQANQLVDDANKLPDSETSVNDDWNTK